MVTFAAVFTAAGVKNGGDYVEMKAVTIGQHFGENTGSKSHL